MANISRKQLYHELLSMSPREVEALKEAGKQIIGMPASSEWFPMEVSKPVVHHGHYRRWAAMPTGHDIASALQRDTGAGFFDSLKHGFSTVVRNARKIHDVASKAVKPAMAVSRGLSSVPVIGKYAQQATGVLETVEKGLVAAEKGIRIAEGLERRINPAIRPAAPRTPPVPAPPLPPPVPAAAPLPPPVPSVAPRYDDDFYDPDERQVFGRVPSRGAGLRGAGVPGGRLRKRVF